MSLRSEALSDGERPPRGTAAPSGDWVPGVRLEAHRGVLTSKGTVDGHPDWATIFAHWNLDPEAWEVDEATLKVNAWEGPTADGVQVLRQYKAEIRRRGRWLDVDPILHRIASFKSRQVKPTGTDEATFVVVCADWQVGPKPDEFMDRFERSLSNVERLAKQSKASSLVCLFAGDMREGLNASYPSQEFHAQLDNSEQGRMVRACEATVLKRLSPKFTETTAAAVAGNHGRKGGEVTTRHSDNYDLDDFEHVAEVLLAAGHDMRFMVPDRDSTGVLIDCSGTSILLHHGDPKRGKADTLIPWWKDTAFTETNGAHAADILVTGHRHHLRVEELAVRRTLMVAPTLGPASDWFSQGGGGTSTAGTLCFTTAGGQWWGLHVA